MELFEKADRIVHLMNLRLVGKLDEAGKAELRAFTAQSVGSEVLIRDVETLPAVGYLQPLESYDTAKGWSQLKKRLFSGIYGEVNHVSNAAWKIAAVLILFIGGAIMAYLMLRDEQKEVVAGIQQHQVPAGTEYPLLILSDGTRIRLDSLPDNTLLKQAQVDILKKAPGEISYSALKEDNQSTGSMNTLFVPGGQLLKVKLPDGTSVIINGGSAIQYPTGFTDTSRVVSLTGEAYFDVAQNQGRPFRVKAAGAEISVIGTRFNVNAYTNEPITRTSLLEGKLLVRKNKTTVHMMAGNEARIDKQRDSITLVPVSEDVISWTTGITQYQGSLEGLMRLMQRRFDMEVEFDRVPVKYLENKVVFELETRLPVNTWLAVLNAIISGPSNGELWAEIQNNKLVLRPR